jgi:hypothetical protein
MFDHHVNTDIDRLHQSADQGSPTIIKVTAARVSSIFSDRSDREIPLSAKRIRSAAA